MESKRTTSLSGSERQRRRKNRLYAHLQRDMHLRPSLLQLAPRRTQLQFRRMAQYPKSSGKDQRNICQPHQIVIRATRPSHCGAVNDSPMNPISTSHLIKLLTPNRMRITTERARRVPSCTKSQSRLRRNESLWMAAWKRRRSRVFSCHLPILRSSSGTRRCANRALRTGKGEAAPV